MILTFFFDSLLALDAPGEWYLDRNSLILYFYAPDGSSPSNYELEYKKRNNAFNLDNRNHVTVRGFNIFAAVISALGSENCHIDQCHIRYAGHSREGRGYSIQDSGPAMSGTGHIWENGSIVFAADSGLNVWGDSHVIRNMRIRDVNYSAGHTAGIQFSKGGWGGFSANAVVVENNTVINAGRMGIAPYQTGNSEIRHNYVSNVCLNTRDGGNIYCWGTDGQGSVIHHNFLENNQADWGGGIYLDDHSRNFVVHHNIIRNITWWGLTLKNYNEHYHNTVINAGVDFWNLQPAGGDDMSSGSFINNVASEQKTGLAVCLRQPTITDYAWYEQTVSINGEWQTIVLEVNEFVQASWGEPRQLTLEAVSSLDFICKSIGDYWVEIDNLRWIEPDLPVDDFEDGDLQSTGGAWSSISSSMNSVTSGAGLSGRALHFQGVSRAMNQTGVSLELNHGAVEDIRPYRALAFDVRGDHNLLADVSVGNPPENHHNSFCRLNADAFSNRQLFAGCRSNRHWDQ